MIGVHDKTLDIVGIDIYNYDHQKTTLLLTERYTNADKRSEGWNKFLEILKDQGLIK